MRETEVVLEAVAVGVLVLDGVDDLVAVTDAVLVRDGVLDGDTDGDREVVTSRHVKSEITTRPGPPAVIEFPPAATPPT